MIASVILDNILLAVAIPGQGSLDTCGVNLEVLQRHGAINDDGATLVEHMPNALSDPHSRGLIQEYLVLRRHLDWSSRLSQMGGWRRIGFARLNSSLGALSQFVARRAAG